MIDGKDDGGSMKGSVTVVRGSRVEKVERVEGRRGWRC